MSAVHRQLIEHGSSFDTVDIKKLRPKLLSSYRFLRTLHCVRLSRRRTSQPEFYSGQKAQGRKAVT